MSAKNFRSSPSSSQRVTWPSLSSSWAWRIRTAISASVISELVGYRATPRILLRDAGFDDQSGYPRPSSRRPSRAAIVPDSTNLSASDAPNEWDLTIPMYGAEPVAESYRLGVLPAQKVHVAVGADDARAEEHATRGRSHSAVVVAAN